MKINYVKGLLGLLGYSNEHFSESYSVQIDGTSAVKFDYVAFSDRYLKDISTSCIAVQEVQSDKEENHYIEGAKYLAAPIMIISKENHVRIWNISPQNVKLLADNDEKIIQLYFERNRFEFMSDTLLSIKMGYKQLNLFEATGLIDFSRAATCKLLNQEFEHGLMAAKNYLKTKKNINGQDLNNITSITMHIISALIINSKIRPDEKIPDVHQLLNGLSQAFKEYFSDKVMLKYGNELLDHIYLNLNISINYQSVDHELLGYFYESTLLQLSEQRAESIRKEYGIYYTPKVLSQEITQSIPFENIPVEERYVLDGTCGSGSLLLSACKRLENLVSGEKKEFERHHYLTNMIQGFDMDKFASEVARLSLLLYSLPYGNKWNISACDLLRMNKSQVRIPYIVLGNPPYEETRGNHKKSQKATAFLDKYLDWLHADGYIGIILPESFLQNDSSEVQRKRLLNEFDIFELWILPGQVFQNNCSTIVIIAQKKKIKTENLTKIKILVRNKKSINKYFEKNTWDFEFIENLQFKWKNEFKSKMSVSPVDSILCKISEGNKCIGDITHNDMGIMLSSDYQISKMKVDGFVPYISNAKKFKKYVISKEMSSDISYINYHISKEEESKIKEGYKGFRLRREYMKLYAATNKVLVKMSSTPGEIECINAFVDEMGCYPSHSFFAIVSKDSKVSNDVICVLINSKLINFFVRKECVKRTLTTKVIRSIPVPKFSDSQLIQIKKNFIDIKIACEINDMDKINLIKEKLDTIIFDAFKLNQTDREKVNHMYKVYTHTEDEIVVSEDHKQNYYNVSGQVEQICFSDKSCYVYLAEFGKKKIKIDHAMPGWFLREGAEFSAKYNHEELLDIHPLLKERRIEIYCTEFTSLCHCNMEVYKRKCFGNIEVVADDFTYEMEFEENNSQLLAHIACNG